MNDIYFAWIIVRLIIMTMLGVGIFTLLHSNLLWIRIISIVSGLSYFVYVAFSPPPATNYSGLVPGLSMATFIFMLILQMVLPWARLEREPIRYWLSHPPGKRKTQR